MASPGFGRRCYSSGMVPVEPHDVHATLARHLQTTGHGLVLDLEASRGLWLRDARSHTEYLDFSGFYASNALGFRHPGLEDELTQERLLRTARVKVANPDFYTPEFATFVATLERTCAPSTHPYYFFIEGGALAVENAMKTAMDWKVRTNLRAGRGELGTEILHFEQAFHGRSGYTLSVTNTDPAKVLYFPKFDWPRLSAPRLTFPITDQGRADVLAAEQRCEHALLRAFDERPHRIAAILIEPIQGEGGDGHFRPEFLRTLRRIADEREALLIFDEVQTGGGATGRWWAHEHAAVRPDIVCFAKKLQVGGFFASRRIDSVDHVFRVPSRISSTWGGGLVDMVRSTRILEIVEADGLLDNARDRGTELLRGLTTLCEDFPGLITAARGAGLLCAFDLVDVRQRAEFVQRCEHEQQLLVLSGGVSSVRLRPALTLSAEHVALALQRLRKVCEALRGA